MDQDGYGAAITKNSIEKVCEDRKYFDDLLAATEHDFFHRDKVNDKPKDLTSNLLLLCLALTDRCRKASVDNVIFLRKTQDLNSLASEGAFPHFVLVREPFSKVSLVWSQFFGIPCIHSSNPSHQSLLSPFFWLDGAFLHAVALKSVPEQETRALDRILALFQSIRGHAVDNVRRSLRRDIAILYSTSGNTVESGSNCTFDQQDIKLLIISKAVGDKQQLKKLVVKCRESRVPYVLADNIRQMGFLTQLRSQVACLTFVTSEALPLYESVRERFFLEMKTDDDSLLNEGCEERSVLEVEEKESTKEGIPFQTQSNAVKDGDVNDSSKSQIKAGVVASSCNHQLFDFKRDLVGMQSLSQDKRKSCAIDMESTDILTTKRRSYDFRTDGVGTAKYISETSDLNPIHLTSSKVPDVEKVELKVETRQQNDKMRSVSVLQSNSSTKLQSILNFQDVDPIIMTSEEVTILEFCVESLRERCSQVEGVLDEGRQKREALVQKASDARSRIQALQKTKAQQIAFLEELSKKLEQSRMQLEHLMNQSVE